MLARIAAYLLVLIVGLFTAALLTSREISERIVAAGLLPRGVLRVMPAIVIAIRICGVVLIAVGLLMIAVENGWITPDRIIRFGLPGALVALGAGTLFLSRKRRG